MIPQQYNDKPLVHAWTYRDAQGRTLGVVGRYETPGERKEVVPFFRANGAEWKSGAPPEPRPLFGLDVLANGEGRAVFIVEGEKSAAALHGLGLVTVTSIGGSPAASKADWTPLSGCLRTYLLPDKDDPGEQYARDVAAALGALESPPELFLVRLDGLPEGGDVVDWIQARSPGWNGYAPIPEAARGRLRKDFEQEVKARAEPIPADWMKEAAPGAWSDPIPLPPAGGGAVSPPFPMKALPKAIKEAAQEVARFSKTDPAASAVAGLSALAVAIGKRAVVVERPGLEHYLALFFCLIAGTGERKTGTFKGMTRALDAWTKAQRVRWEEAKAGAESFNSILDNQIAVLKRKAKENTRTEDFAAELAKLEATRKPIPPSPKLYDTDATEQYIVRQLAKRAGAFAVLSSEGRPVVDHIIGKYSGGDGRTGDSVYLAGISGDTITRGRVGSEGAGEDWVIHDPCLNVCVMIQPDKYLDMASRPVLRDSGLIPRIFPVWLASMAGKQHEAKGEPGLNPAALAAYESMLAGILDTPIAKDEKGQDVPHRAILGEEATEARRLFHNFIQDSMADGRDLEDCRSIAQKVVSQTCKMALVLHVAKDWKVLTQAESVIDAKTWAAAQALGAYFLNEAVRSQRLADEDKTLELARRILAWAMKEGKTAVTVAEISNFLPRPRPKAEQARVAMAVLEDLGHVRQQVTPEHRKPVFVFHPGPNSRNSQNSQGRG